MDKLLAFLKDRRQAGTLRELRPIQRLGGGRLKLANQPDAPELLDFSSNDYLALNEHPELIKAGRQTLKDMGAGAGAARLMSGSLELNHRLEKETARLKGREAALVFGSGYLANIGIIPALADRGDVIFSDRLNHASIYDGCRLAGARTIRFFHNDLGHLERLLKEKRGDFKQALIVVESIYSMDGDLCPLAGLVELKNRYDCLLMVDEAHATGIFGTRGGGIIEQEGLEKSVDIAMGTFGKALGSYGAYAASSQAMISYLINRARSFIYSTALPPAVLGASLAAVRLVRNQPELRHELHDKSAFFKKQLQGLGYTDDLGPSQIVPIMIGASRLARAMAEELENQGIFATAVRPPTVPRNTARLRFSITRHLTTADLKKTAEILVSTLEKIKG